MEFFRKIIDFIIGLFCKECKKEDVVNNSCGGNCGSCSCSSEAQQSTDSNLIEEVSEDDTGVDELRPGTNITINLKETINMPDGIHHNTKRQLSYKAENLKCYLCGVLVEYLNKTYELKCEFDRYSNQTHIDIINIEESGLQPITFTKDFLNSTVWKHLDYSGHRDIIAHECVEDAGDEGVLITVSVGGKQYTIKYIIC